MQRCFILSAALLISLVSRTAGADLSTLWTERIKCAVAVEYVATTEMERHTTIAYGTVIDSSGTIALPSAAIDLRIPPSQLKDFRVYRPNDPEGTPAEYLGRDALTGWHFVRAAASVRSLLVPVTAFTGAGAPREAGLAEDVWGIALRNKEEEFAPYIMQSHVALIEDLPQRTAIAQQEVAGPGLPVFDRDGRFLGLGASSFGQTYLQFSNVDRGGTPVMLVNVEESSAFVTAAEVLPYLGRIPHNVFGRPLAWLGAYGLEPMDREVGTFLKLNSQSGAVVSEVLEGSPAERAGLKPRDIILAVDGKPLPRFRPERIVVDYIDRLIAARAPGDAMALSVLRGVNRQEIKVVLAEEPELVREAPRRYFDRIGLGVRQFVYGDAAARRVATNDQSGVVAYLVKPNGPADVAGLRTDDWIKEIDGAEVRTFEAASAKLASIEAELLRSEVVVLVSRGGDTAVLRIKLH